MYLVPAEHGGTYEGSGDDTNNFQQCHYATSHSVTGPAPWIARTVPAAFCRLNAIPTRFIVFFTSRRSSTSCPRSVNSRRTTPCAATGSVVSHNAFMVHVGSTAFASRAAAC